MDFRFINEHKFDGVEGNIIHDHQKRQISLKLRRGKASSYTLREAKIDPGVEPFGLEETPDLDSISHLLPEDLR
jgi:hypothetical protein